MGISYDGKRSRFQRSLPEKLREDSEKLVIKKVANVPAKNARTATAILKGKQV